MIPTFKMEQNNLYFNEGKKIVPKDIFWFLFTSNIRHFSVSKSWLSSITRFKNISIHQTRKFLAANRDQVNIYLGQGPLFLSRALTEILIMKIEYEGKREEVLIFSVNYKMQHTYICTNIFIAYYHIKSVKRQEKYIIMRMTAKTG